MPLAVEENIAPGGGGAGVPACAVGTGSTARPGLLKQVAQRAEALGFESIWIPAHLVIPLDMKTPYPYSPNGKFPGGPTVPVHDPLLALEFAPGCTERIKLGTGVFVLPLRNALAVAKAVASLDVLSNGRFLFGVGMGWLEEEFDAVGMPFKDRAARTREAIRMMVDRIFVRNFFALCQRVVAIMPPRRTSWDRQPHVALSLPP
jgi:alkanesulfonate monooxygenase SsuD/methylene tetrahydromethanopterin reductase-like flavin-dependent oxidoreductase (luciferase family)